MLRRRPSRHGFSTFTNLVLVTAWTCWLSLSSALPFPASCPGSAALPIASTYWGLIDSSPYPFVIENASVYRRLADGTGNLFGYETFCLKDTSDPFSFTSGSSGFTGVLIITNNMPGLSADTCFLLFLDGQTFSPLAMVQLYPSVPCTQAGVTSQPPTYPGQQAFIAGVTTTPCPASSRNTVPTWQQGSAIGAASSTSPVISNISIGDTFVTHSLAVSFGSGLPTYSFASICLADVTYRADVAPGFAVAATEGSGRCYVLVRGADLAADPMATQLLAYENSTQMSPAASCPSVVSSAPDVAVSQFTYEAPLPAPLPSPSAGASPVQLPSTSPSEAPASPTASESESATATGAASVSSSASVSSFPSASPSLPASPSAAAGASASAAATAVGPSSASPAAAASASKPALPSLMPSTSASASASASAAPSGLPATAGVVLLLPLSLPPSLVPLALLYPANAAVVQSAVSADASSLIASVAGRLPSVPPPVGIAVAWPRSLNISAACASGAQVQPSGIAYGCNSTLVLSLLFPFTAADAAAGASAANFSTSAAAAAARAMSVFLSTPASFTVSNWSRTTTLLSGLVGAGTPAAAVLPVPDAAASLLIGSSAAPSNLSPRQGALSGGGIAGIIIGLLILGGSGYAAWRFARRRATGRRKSLHTKSSGKGKGGKTVVVNPVVAAIAMTTTQPKPDAVVIGFAPGAAR